MNSQNWQTRWLCLGFLAALAWFASATPAFAQGGGGGGAGGGGGGAGGGGAGGGGSGGGGGGAKGGTSGGAKGTSTTSGIPSTVNPFSTYYGNAFAAGFGPGNTLTPNNSLNSSSSGTSGISNFQLLQSLSATIGTPAFGSPLVTQTTGKSATGSTLGGLGGTSGITGRYAGISTYGMRRAPVFVTALAEDLKPSPYSSLVPQQNVMLLQLRSTLDRSSSLRAPSNIQLQMEDNTVILTGVVLSDRERRLAEGLMRVTPGVRAVRNELVVNRPIGQ